MPKQIFTIRDFSGGVNSARDPRDIDVKEFAYLKNFYVDQIGALRPCGSDIDSSSRTGISGGTVKFYNPSSNNKSTPTAPAPPSGL